MIVHDEMHEVRLTGWRKGAQKVSATNVIRAHTEMGLVQAKDIIDRCLDGQATIISFDSAEPAICLAEEMDELGFIAKVFKSETGKVVWQNQAEHPAGGDAQ
jgi:ribosomal protein L7/L12